MTTNINNMQKEQATESTEVAQNAEGNLSPEPESGVENLEIMLDKGEEKHQEAEADQRELEAKCNHARRGAEQLRPQARLNTLNHERAVVDRHIQSISKRCSKDQARLDKAMPRYHSRIEALRVIREQCEVQGHENLFLNDSQAAHGFWFRMRCWRNARKLRAAEHKLDRALCQVEQAVYRVSGNQGVLEFLEDHKRTLSSLYQEQEGRIMVQQSAMQQAQAVETLLQNSELATAAKSGQGRKRQNTAPTPLFDQHAE